MSSVINQIRVLILDHILVLVIFPSLSKRSDAKCERWQRDSERRTAFFRLSCTRFIRWCSRSGNRGSQDIDPNLYRVVHRICKGQDERVGSSSEHDRVVRRRILVFFPHCPWPDGTFCHGRRVVVEEGKRDTHQWKVTSSGDLDFEPHGLGFLLGFDEDVSTCRASFRFLRMKRYPQGFQIATERISGRVREGASIGLTWRVPKMSNY